MSTYPVTSAWYRQNGGAWWATLAGSAAPCGKNSGGTNSYETRMAVDFAAIRAANVNSYITSAKLYIRATAEYGTSGVYARITTAAYGVLASGSGASGAAGSWISITLGAAEIAALTNGSAVYVGTYGTANGSYFQHYTTATSQAYLDITWAARAPSPTPPSFLAVSTPVKIDSPTFTWTAGTDHLVSQANLVYDLQMSFNGGNTWSTSQYSSAGATSKAINLKTLLSLQAKQYYYNTAVKFRARTLAHWNGTDYASTWVTSGVITVDYRIPPTAPTSISASKADLYEGEATTITLGRPANYNTHTNTGADMVFVYEVYTGPGGMLISSAQDKDLATVALPVTIGNLTTGKSDLVTTIRAYVKDSMTQAGPESARIPFTIRRFRAPTVSISSHVRNEGNAVVQLLISDTGYGGTQAAAQIAKIQGRIDGGTWQDITPDSVTGLLATITTPGMASGSRYTLGFRAVNVAPAGTALAGQTGAETVLTVLPYLPSAGAFYDSATGTDGLWARSLRLGNDPTVAGFGSDYIAGKDDRNTASTTDIGRMMRITLKSNGTDGLADGGSFHTILQTQTWTDSSGGNIHEIGLTVNGNMYIRTAPIGGTWSAWDRIVRVGNLASLFPAWTNATYQNSWTTFSGWTAAGYYKDPFGIVHLRGMITGGTIGAAAFTLPTGYRPPNAGAQFPVASNSALGRVYCNSDGRVIIETPSNNAWVSLEGIQFRV